MRDTDVVSRPAIKDYQSRDTQEHVHGLFRPRMRVYARYLADLAAHPEKPHDKNHLQKELYRPIEVAFVEEGPDPTDLPARREPVSVVIRKVFETIDAYPGAQHAGIGRKPESGFSARPGDWFIAAWGGSSVKFLEDQCHFTSSSKIKLREKSTDTSAMYAVAPVAAPKTNKFAEASQSVVYEMGSRLRLRYKVEKFTSNGNFAFWVKGRDRNNMLRFQAAYHTADVGKSKDGRNWSFQGLQSVYTNPLRQNPMAKKSLTYPPFYSLHKKIPEKQGQWHEVVIDPRADLNEKLGAPTWDSLEIVTLELIPCATAGSLPDDSFHVAVGKLVLEGASSSH